MQCVWPCDLHNERRRLGFGQQIILFHSQVEEGGLPFFHLSYYQQEGTWFMAESSARSMQARLRFIRTARLVIGMAVLLFLVWRLYSVLVIDHTYTADTWVRFGLSGSILGGMYALIAIGYTLVYGIMFMINFAHGEVMMIGAFAGYFTFEILRFLPAPSSTNPDLNFLNAISSILLI